MITSIPIIPIQGEYDTLQSFLCVLDCLSPSVYRWLRNLEVLHSPKFLIVCVGAITAEFLGLVVFSRVGSYKSTEFPFSANCSMWVSLRFTKQPSCPHNTDSRWNWVADIKNIVDGIRKFKTLSLPRKPRAYILWHPSCPSFFIYKVGFLTADGLNH